MFEVCKVMRNPIRFSAAACGSRWQIEAAHTGIDGGMSQKASDYSCIPLCRDCHTGGRTAYHRIGRLEFERLYRISFADVVGVLTERWDAMMAESGRAWRQ